jgi:O-acetyl-ADP-ribose deacetylase (regulator of RNase III)
VGPVWAGGNHGEPELLAACYRACYRLAHEHELGTMAFPAISCGVYGYPTAQAVRIAAAVSLNCVTEHPGFSKIIFACFNRAALDLYQSELDKL